MNTVSIGEGFGRVNLIGEHLDYNGGHVLPLQIKNSQLSVRSLKIKIVNLFR